MINIADFYRRNSEFYNKTGAETPTSTPAPQSLFGVDVETPMDLNTSKGFVLSGLSEAAKPILEGARSSLNQRGFGRYSSPTMEATVYNKYIQPWASQTRTALTDLWFKDQANTRANTQTDMAYDLAQGQIKAQAKKNQSGLTVLCTELYKQGLLSFSHIKYDLKFLKKYVTKDQHEKYLAWACPVVMVMRKSRTITILVFIPVYFWGEYMKRTVRQVPLGIAGRIGLLIHKLGIAFGEVYSTRREKVKCL